MTQTIEQATDNATPVETSDGPDAIQPIKQVFRHTAEVHVEEADFHAFIRLPNQFQHADIRTKALAAKARRIRQLRDQESDACVILEADMEEIHRSGDREAVIDELVNREWWKDHLEAVRDVQEREEFEHVEDDQRRLAEIEAMPEDERPAEEYAELQRHIDAYDKAVRETRDERQKPRREALSGRDMNELVDLVREDRIAAEGNAVFNLTFSMWEWFSGTYRLDDGKVGPRYFGDIEHIQNADPMILEALATAFGDLESSFQRGLAGNS